MFFKIVFLSLVLTLGISEGEKEDRRAIEQAVLDYIESQHQTDPKRMAAALHEKLAKRTYWLDENSQEILMESNFETMVVVAERYNKDGTKFPANPKKEIEILDVDGRVASVKLTADDWIDYMHLLKNENGEWKIINVLWQFHDQKKHGSFQGDDRQD